MHYAGASPIKLQQGATVAIVGGGPAGSFAAIHLLRQARRRGHPLRVVIFERRREAKAGRQADGSGQYQGCPQCAGGISPGLNDALQALELALPVEVIQSRVTSITVQGNWKNIKLSVPEGRSILSVYRGALPYGQHTPQQCFDSMLLDSAVQMGAELIASRVCGSAYNKVGIPVLRFEANSGEKELEADLVLFAGGVNEKTDHQHAITATGLFSQLQPRYRPPGLRRALIFELEAPATGAQDMEGEMHFIESSTGSLQLDMCSILPKRNYYTVTVIGKSVDRAADHQQVLQLIRDFLALPQIRRTLPPEMKLRIRCICNPSIVVGCAKLPYGDRCAAIGDMATSRQYKDGILSAHNMAQDLARAAFERGIDFRSLQAGYGPTIAQFRRDNRFATLIYFVYRWFFTSPFLSRVIYQTYTSEQKSMGKGHRSVEDTFYAISSGDQSYEKIAWSMLRPGTLWKILTGGVYITVRNWLAERFFGLDWSGVGRFPTAVPLEQLEEKRERLLRGHECEFECIYTIHVRASVKAARLQLAKFGEADRPYLNPRWVSIRRTAGEPLQPGCVINYCIFGGLMSFSIEQLPSADPQQIRFKVRDGFANGGWIVFEVQRASEPQRGCFFTIYLAFDYVRGRSWHQRIFWRAFRLLFPEFIHDVLWNHALCQFRQAAEAVDLETEPDLIELQQLY